MKKREKKKGETGNWMDTYGDMVTLLLCFFVLMYSISTVDTVKWRNFVKSMNPNAEDQVSQLVLDTDAPPDSEDVPGGSDLDESADREKIDEDFNSLYEDLQEMSKESGGDILVTEGDDFVFIMFRDRVIFEGDSSVLLKEGEKVIDHFAETIKPYKEAIKELQIMGGALENPKRPFVAVLGGAKVSDKIGVINNLLDKADTIIIGGGMAYTFAKAQGGEIGKSLCESDKLDYALDMIEKAKKNGVKLLLPTDTLAATEFAPNAESRVVPTGAIPADMEGMDIGPDTTAAFCEAVKGAGTVVWNGPMGVFEFERFAQGTRAMAQALADSGAVTIVGGGDSAAAVEQMGFADKITHISTGGGASLEFLEGIELPGVACLMDK